ncbi:MAG TPA: hypothetical protein VKY45_12460 [Marinilabiliaceae bacterium]|nr:hypothetical protein [Marinilabiliaceae bacterium]
MTQVLKQTKKTFIFSMLLMAILVTSSCKSKNIVIWSAEDNSDRVQFGILKLKESLKDAGYNVSVSSKPEISNNELILAIGTTQDSLPIQESGLHNNIKIKESFKIKSKKHTIIISGSEASGVLYGCLELADRIKTSGKLPEKIDFTDAPEMVLRGTCIGLQKTEYLPGRTVYEYPYTPENFPWFYDKLHWIEYLDMMVENRFNSLYLWNGHPFASLVKLDDYPYAVEVDEETFELNEEMFGFITEEANKRGIWVIQMFYNILISKPFAEHHNIKTQDRSRPIVPLISDYTRKSVASFIEKYPNVGLLVCLGEAISSIEDDVEWFTETIIPGVQDGLNKLGRIDEPPIVLRGHDTDGEKVMTAALPIYKNLYTMSKYNGESLTTYEPRDSWERIPKSMSKLGSIHISNVHILANLEPFRYGSPDFIQKSTKAMHDIQGANGLHLYPQTSYWDWPYTADKASPRIKQVDRDWIWYKAWGRYAWNYQRGRKDEITYWANQLADYYGCGDKGKDILKAYEQTGEIAPKLLRTFGISDGNRQTLLLGMFMGQLVNPHKYNVYADFWTSSGPLKEVLEVYAEKEYKGETHKGETPPQIIAEVVEHGRKAVEAIENASPKVSVNNEEFVRLRNDVHCYNVFANFFAEKVKAASFVLRYKHSNNISDLEKAIPYLERSVVNFSELVDLTKESYLYANSMQTAQRRIPITGIDGTNKTWEELLPHYQAELDNFKRNVNTLKSSGSYEKAFKELKPASVEITNPRMQFFSFQKGQSIYTDNKVVIEEYAPELKNLKGLKLSDKTQREKGTTLHFKNDKPIKILVGYFNTNSYTVVQPPTLETNAAANDRGQADIKIANALKLNGLYPVNIYTYKFSSGENELNLGKGRVLILGFIDGNEKIDIRDAELTDNMNGAPIDWLFY